MYCVKCGVKLADSQDRCPLCGTTVYHPEMERPVAESLYPDILPEKISRSKGGAILLLILFVLPALLVTVCDWQINKSITWSGYVTGALALGYVCLGLPVWFRKPNPVIFTPCAFAAAGLYLLYINWATNGSWFLAFALPVTGGLCLIVTAVVTLMRYVSKGKFFIFGGASIVLGGFMLLVEYLLNDTFHLPAVGWSVYPLVVLAVLGGVLIYLGVSRPAREMLARKLFI